MEKDLMQDDGERMIGQTYQNATINPDNDEITRSENVEQRLSTGYRTYWEYLEYLGLAGDPNMIILSPSQHYFYDLEDLKEVSTILNLKQLNYIRDLKEFLKTLNHMLSDDMLFIGSFIDRKYQFSFFSNYRYPDHPTRGVDPVENGISSKIPLLNLIYDFLDSRTNNMNMTKKSVTAILEDSGFSVVDMTEINGLLCFCARKARN